MIYDLLTRSEQILLSRLSVFAAGFTLAAVEAVCAGYGTEANQVLDLPSSLANQSLLVAHTLNRSEASYSLLETIRQYAQEKLIASGEWDMIHDHHLDWFLKIAMDCEPKLTSSYQRVWLDWLEELNENTRIALDWAFERAVGM